MNTSPEDPILIAVATTVADGLPVDWESLIVEHPAIAADLRALRVLQGVAVAGDSMGDEKGQGKG
jgi:hypothetical protein